MSTALRRIVLLLVATVVAGGAAVTLRNRRVASPAPPPQWPPLEAAHVERIHVGLAKGRPETGKPTFIEPPSSGAVPDEYPIKAKDGSKIFHVPGGRFYDRTMGDRLYASADAAIADGYRQSKS